MPPSAKGAMVLCTRSYAAAPHFGPSQYAAKLRSGARKRAANNAQENPA